MRWLCRRGLLLDSRLGVPGDEQRVRGSFVAIYERFCTLVVTATLQYLWDGYFIKKVWRVFPESSLLSGWENVHIVQKKDPWTSSSLRDKYVCFQIVLAFQWAHRDGFRAQGQLLTPSELGDRSPQRRRRWSNSGSRVPDPVVRTKGILLCEQSVPTLSGPISELRWS